MIIDIDDSSALQEADRQSRLRRAASTGAHIRSVAQSLASGGSLAVLRGTRPRAVIWVTDDSDAAIAAEMTAVIAGEYCDPVHGVPVVVSGALPKWAGSLDCIVVAGENAGNPALVDACTIANQRGADLVLSAPFEGPLKEASGENPILIDSPVGMLGDGLIHQLAVGVAVLIALGALAKNAYGEVTDGDFLFEVADLLDLDASLSAPDKESVVNLEKQRALSMLDRRVIFAHGSAMTKGIVRYGSALLLQAGIIVASASVNTVLRSLGALSLEDSSNTEDIFFDPFLSEGSSASEQAALPLRILIPTSAEEARILEARTGTLLQKSLWVMDDINGSFSPVLDVFRFVASLDMTAAYVAVIGGK